MVSNFFNRKLLKKNEKEIQNHGTTNLDGSCLKNDSESSADVQKKYETLNSRKNDLNVDKKIGWRKLFARRTVSKVDPITSTAESKDSSVAQTTAPPSPSTPVSKSNEAGPAARTKGVSHEKLFHNGSASQSAAAGVSKGNRRRTLSESQKKSSKSIFVEGIDVAWRKKNEPKQNNSYLNVPPKGIEGKTTTADWEEVAITPTSKNKNPPFDANDRRQVISYARVNPSDRLSLDLPLHLPRPSPLAPSSDRDLSEVNAPSISRERKFGMSHSGNGEPKHVMVCPEGRQRLLRIAEKPLVTSIYLNPSGASKEATSPRRARKRSSNSKRIQTCKQPELSNLKSRPLELNGHNDTSVEPLILGNQICKAVVLPRANRASYEPGNRIFNPRVKPVEAVSKPKVYSENSMVQRPVRSIPMIYQTSQPMGTLSEELCVDVKDLVFESALGVGGAAEVWKATWRGTEVAVKILHQNIQPGSSFRLPTPEFYRELQIMSRLRHPHLVLLMGASVSHWPICMVSDFCEGGSLFELLYETKARLKLSFSQKLKIALDVAKGCLFLHTSKPLIIHKDLKSLNILLAKPVYSSRDLVHAKIADFGLSRSTSNDGVKNSYEIQFNGTGTACWMAPELFKNQVFDETIDIYAFGVVLFEIFSGVIPYSYIRPMLSHDEIAVRVINGLRPDVRYINSESRYDSQYTRIKHLMQQCWSGIPSQRPLFNFIVQELKDLMNLTS